MALGGHEILLIIRGQNQASQALRRVGMDMQRLGSIKDLQLRQGQLAITQATNMAQRQGILNRQQALAREEAKARELYQTRLNRIDSVAMGQMAQRASLTRRMQAIEAERGSKALQLERQILGSNATRLKGVASEQALTQELANAYANLSYLRENHDKLLSEGVMTEEEHAKALKASEKATVSYAQQVGAATLANAGQAVAIERNRTLLDDTGKTYTEMGMRMQKFDKDVAINEARRASAATALENSLAGITARSKVAGMQLSNSDAKIAHTAETMKQGAKAINQMKWERLSTGARIVTHLGRVLQMAGLVGGAAVGYLGYQAAQFSSDATLVATQTGKVGTGFNVITKNSKYLQNALLGVMKQSTATRQEITQSAYDIYSSTNVGLGGGIKMLKLFARASIAGMTPLQDVTAAGITVMNDFKLSVKDMPAIMQRMFAAVRFGRMNFQQFVSTLSQTVPAFAAAGGSFNDLTGAMAFLTRRMPSIRMASTGLARMMEIFGRKEFVKGAKEFGVSITDLHGKLLPLPQILDKLITRFPKLAEGGTFLQNFFKMITAGKDQKGGLTGTIQARRVFTLFMKDLQGYHQISGQVIHDNNEYSRSFAAMSKTAGVQFQVFMNNLKAFGIMLGAAILPSLVKLTAPLQKIVNWFENLDKAQRDTLGKYATYGAAFLLFGGTVLSVGGMIVSFIATLGKFGIAGSGFIAVVVGIIAIVKVLTGQWHSLSNAISDGVNTMLGSWQGFIAMSSLVVVAALKMTKAIKSLMELQVASTLAGAGGGLGRGGGLLAGLGTAVTAGRFASYAKEIQGASRLRSILSGVGAAAFALPGPLKIAAAAIGLSAGAALLWQKHMQGVEAHTQRIQALNDMIARVGARPGAQVKLFGRLGLDTREVVSAKNALGDVNSQIAKLQKQIASANRSERPDLQRQLSDLYLQRADAIDALRSANTNANVSFNAMTGYIQKQARVFARIGSAHQQLVKEVKDLAHWQDVANASGSRGSVGAYQHILTLKEGISNLRREIKTWSGDSLRAANAVRAKFAQTVRSLGEAHLLPKASAGAIDAMTRTALSRGRMLTIPEMRGVIKAYADPATLRRMPKDIQRAINAAKYEVHVKAQENQARKDFPKFAKSLGKFIPAVQVIAQPNVVDARRARSKTAQIFHQTIKQKVVIDAPKNAAALGAQIGQQFGQGLQGGLSSVNIEKTISITINKHVVGAAKKYGGIHSPSTRMNKEVGVPLMEGLIQGILSKLPDLEKTSQLAVDFFQGPWMTSDAFSKKKRTTFNDLYKDLRGTTNLFAVFNGSLAKLHRRHIPLQMLSELEQLGTDGAKYIKILASASRSQLARYVALWRKAQREIAASQHVNYEEIMGNLQQYLTTAAQNLLDKYNEIADGIKSSWLDITNIAQWGVAQHAMSGTRMLRNANAMMGQFKQFSDLLNSLIKRGLPLDMALQLAQMGPSALPILMGLNSMTKDQFDQFVGIWQSAQTQIDKLTKQLMNDQIKEWKKHGANIALGIISGVMSEQDALLRFFRKLFKNLLTQARRETKSHSPSKVFEALGKDIVGGLALGIGSGDNLRVPMPRIALGGSGGRSGGDVYMTVNAQHSEDLMTTLHRAAFRIRNRPL